MAGLLERLAALETEVGADNKGSKGANNTPTPEKAFGSPHVRKGENVMGSRGFSFLKLAGVMSKVLDADDAKLEGQVAEIFHKSFSRTGDYTHTNPGSVLAPLGCDYLPDSHRGDSVFAEVKSLVLGGTAGADQDEMTWLRQKMYSSGQKAQSWLDQSIGGSLVAPPEQGELIDLLRNKDALVSAGAQIVPLPPQGRVAFPRQTQASTGYYVGENQEITQSQVKTGSLILSAKKVAVLINTPNELIRYGGPAAEALFRNDMTKTCTLTMDKRLLDGVGSDVAPMGIVNTPGVVSITAGTTGTDGDTLKAEDIYSFMSAVAANNAQFESWILRPEMFFALLKRRGGTGAGASTGPFLFDQSRTLGQGFAHIIGGYPAVLTPQVSNTRIKGSGTNLTYMVGGQFSDYLLGMFGAIEFAAATQGDTAFAQDQTVIRAILSHDGGARHPGSLAVADDLLVA